MDSSDTEVSLSAVEEDLEELAERETDPTPPQKGKGKRKAVKVHLTEEQRDQAIEFLKQRPYIYDKNEADYKDYPRRKREWNYLADMLGVTQQVLAAWYKSMRTMLARAKKTHSKSGSSASLSAGLQSLETRMGFILPFIHEMSLKTMGGGKRKRGTHSSTGLDPESAVPAATATQAATTSASAGQGPAYKQSDMTAMAEYCGYLKGEVGRMVARMPTLKSHFWNAMAARAEPLDQARTKALEDEVWEVVKRHVDAAAAMAPSPPPPPQAACIQHSNTPTIPVRHDSLDYLLDSPIRVRQSPRKGTPKKARLSAGPSTYSTLNLDDVDLGFQ